ncbi:SDR family NAD(P)-dependent oxidoreductase [Micromonospora sp. DT233]|uniref:type I polyketide synthase n=1 Tax=Micromonospora sp. DT233 TaxID=3393432 RepID=UPI003CE8EFE9
MELDAAYWYRNLRQPVRFHDVTKALVEEGQTAFVECSAHPVLIPAIGEGLGTLRRGEDDVEQWLRARAEAFVTGLPVEWPSEPRADALALPTYPFQRQRYWLEDGDTGPVDAHALGLRASTHPLLPVWSDLPDGETVLFSGRLSLRAQPWLAEHAVFGTVLVPGTALVDMVLHAGRGAGLDELVLHAPLVLGEQEERQLQVGVTGSEAVVRSRATDDGEWTTHALARLGDGAETLPPAFPAWPPSGAETIDADALYRQFSAAGYEYGPLFRGVRRAWRRPGELLAEVAVDAATPVDGFGLHPALFDAALHPLVRLDGDDGVGAARLPFSWSRVRLDPAAAGTRTLRVRLTGDGDDSVRVEATDEAGRPVLTADRLTLRPVEEAKLRGAAIRDLYELAWRPVSGLPSAGTPRHAVLAVGGVAPADLPAGVGVFTDLAGLAAAPGPLPDLVLVCGEPGASAGTAVRTTAAMAALLREWLTDPRWAGARLVAVTRRAVATGPADTVDDLAHAPIWGLLRSAEREHPGRVGLLDLGDADPAAVPAALRALGVEWQIAVRGGDLLVPRLTRYSAGEGTTGVAASLGGPGGTVVVTGGTGTLGALLARHLVGRHGVRQLLLLSRRGPDAPGAGDLADDLRAQGAQVTIAACDVTDAEAVRARLAAVPAEHPVTAVVHAAAVLDDATVTNLTPERLAAVLAPKIDAARVLADAAPGRLVLFSSAAAVLGSPGQAAYAAANAFLEAFAAHRSAGGHPTTALGWGLWAQESAMTAGLRGARPVVGLPTAQALDLFDAAVGAGRPVLFPVRFDRTALAGDDVPPVLADLAGPRPAPTGPSAGASVADGAEQRRRLEKMAPEERAEALDHLVRTHVAALLRHPGPEAVGRHAPFKDLGFDSLTAVQLRNQLAAALELTLPSTLVFDHPNPAALAASLGDQLAAPEAEDDDVFAAIDRLEAALARGDGGAPQTVAARLRVLANRFDRGGDPAPAGRTDPIEAASTDELLDLIDKEFGAV